MSAPQAETTVASAALAPSDPLLQADYTDTRCTDPLPLTDDPTSLPRILEHAAQFGFVRVHAPSAGEASESINDLASRLGLGEPYVPRHYRLMNLVNSYGQTMSDVIRTDDPEYLCFTETFALDYHVDGLLERLGTVKTSILYCVRAAETGGRTILLNAAALFTELKVLDPQAAEALTAPRVLTRRCTVPGSFSATYGPAFSQDDLGRVITRYSTGETDEWRAPKGRKDDLRRALQFFEAHNAADGRYRASLLLEPGEFLVLCNDRISHAREHYTNSPAGYRHLVRALYREPLGEGTATVS